MILALIKKAAPNAVLFASSFWLALAVNAPAFAQAGPYVNTTNGAINGSTTCGAPLTRTIAVPDSFIIADLDFGFLVTHTWRTDVQLDITSPQGTTVRAINAPANFNRDNYNVQLNDESGTPINTGFHTTSDGTVAPPYENNVQPSNVLSAFDGENAQGTWTLTICDTFPGADNGTFLRGELIFTAATGADLSLTKTASNQFPNIGANVIYTLQVANAGPLAATGVQVRDLLPSGVTYISDNSGGAYNPGSGVWTISGSIASGASVSLQITVNVNASGSYTNLAEVIASNQSDMDSTPNNSGSAPFEDDTDTISLVPGGGGAGTPPTLSCSASPSIHDWDSNNWPAGSLAQNYTSGGEAFAFQFTGNTNRLITFIGQQMPATSTTLTGGITPAENSLLYVANFSNTSESITLDIDIGATGVGVAELQFTVFDVDINAAGAGAGFVDRIQVTGFLNGALVAPVLTNGPANTTSGFTATGIAAAASATPDGNVVVTFTSNVDKVVITYGNGAGAPSNPGQQGIAVHDLDFCPATGAVLSASKSVSLYDPSGAGLFAIPGNDVIYTITSTNTGDGSTDIDSIFLVDELPAEVEFYNGDIDDAGPETGAIAFSQTGAGLTFTEATDVRFSSSAAPPANFAACSYSPVAGYDPNVTYICLNPKGAMLAGTPDPSFSVSFRTRIK